APHTEIGTSAASAASGRSRDIAAARPWASGTGGGGGVVAPGTDHGVASGNGGGSCGPVAPTPVWGPAEGATGAANGPTRSDGVLSAAALPLVLPENSVALWCTGSTTSSSRENGSSMTSVGRRFGSALKPGGPIPAPGNPAAAL